MQSSISFRYASNTYSFLYRFFDLGAIWFALKIACFVYGHPLGGDYIIAGLVVSVAYLNLSELLDLYRSWRVGRFSTMVISAWCAVMFSFLAFLLAAFLFKQSSDYSRVILAVWFSLTMFFVFAWRKIDRSLKNDLRSRGIGIKKVAIIGATKSGFNLFLQVQQHADLGYEFEGFYEDRQGNRLLGLVGVQVEGSIDDAIERARKGEIQTLFIALPLKAERRIDEILCRLGDTTVDVQIVPDFLLLSLVHARVEHVGDVNTLSVFESPYHGAKKWLKRAEDIVGASIILMFIAAPMVLIALLIKLTSRGPVIFKQHRYGLDGEPILVWKFRTMKVMEDTGPIVQASKNDSRITPLGHILRRTSLDELPQFFNVLAGGMSIVGPRPHAVSHNEEYRKKVEFYMLRHKVKPGITGWAQINGWRGETDTLDKMKMRIKFDLFYIKHWSLWFDLKIIFLTIFRGFMDKNAR